MIKLVEAKKATIKLDENDRSRGVVEEITICGSNGMVGREFPMGYTMTDCTFYDVQIGDIWVESKFFKPDGTPCKPFVSEEQKQIDSMKTEMVTKEEVNRAYAEGVNEA